MEVASDIQKFYKNQAIFLTGGTGFLGKVLVEKLLRTCRDLKVIYMLVRPKKGKTAQQRFNDIFNYQCFDRLKEEFPDFGQKIRIIEGNCAEPGFALSHKDREILKQDTTIVVHAAADVRLDQPLKPATVYNVKAMKDILELAKGMTQLKVFIYVSTAYTNCPRVDIDEKFYKPGMKAEGLLTLFNVLDEQTMNELTPRLIKGWPNAYTFTKCIAEDIINSEGKDLPIAIVRPAIIISSAEEPLQGWIDNFYGMIGLSVGIMSGCVKSVYCKKSSLLHCVPCDYVVNNIIAAAWDLGKERMTSKNNNEVDNDVPIYNFVGSHKQILTIQQIEDYTNQYKWIHPLNTMIWFPVADFTESLLWHKISVFFLHTFVAYLADFILICAGKKPIAVRKVDKLNKLLMVTSFFTRTPLNFTYNNVEKLWNRMTQEDQKLFNFDMNSFNWDKYFCESLSRGRMYLLNERLEDIPKAKRKIYVFAALHYAVKFLFLYFVFKMFLRLFSLFIKI